jgi:hypothetical protein
MAFIFPALLLLAGSDSQAQSVVTATPGSVDPAKLQPVLLKVTKADGSADAELIGQVQSVNVGSQPATNLKKDAQGITITPPALSPGMYELQLLDSASKMLAKAQLQYQSGSGPAQGSSGNESSTQDITRLREEKAEQRRANLVTYYWYYWLVTAMFLAVLVPFVLAIYRGTSGSRATDNRPLGLPVGSFRSILAYSLVAYLGFYILTSILSVSYFAPPDFLLGIVATVIGFYFGSRSGDEGEAASKTGAVRGIVRQGTNPARGAMVRFKREDGTEPYSRISDVNGRFELTGAKPGKYKVRASLTDSAPSDEQDISIVDGSDHEIEIVIKSAAPSPSTQTGTVQGTVTKPDGTPAPEASVVLSVGGVEKFKKTTDASGKYKIDAVAVGEYEVRAALAQYSETSKVTVTSGGQHTVDLKLK